MMRVKLIDPRHAAISLVGTETGWHWAGASALRSIRLRSCGRYGPSSLWRHGGGGWRGRVSTNGHRESLETALFGDGTALVTSGGEV